LRTASCELTAASVAQPSAALPALRLVLAVALGINAASIEFPTQNGTGQCGRQRAMFCHPPYANGGQGRPRFHISDLFNRCSNRCSPNRPGLFLRGDGGEPMSVSGLNCVESCVTCRLRSRSFFCDLSPRSIEDFDKIKHAAVFPEHTVVLVEGQSPCGIFILCQGRAKLSTTSRDGKTLIVRIAEAGEVLGLHAVITGGPY